MNITDRFLKYVSFDTTSDENSETVPSTAKQKILGRYIADELKEIGLCDVKFDEFGVVYGRLPASKGREDDGAIGFIAHMDTAPAVSGTDIKPRIIHYNGGDIELNPTTVTSVEDFPFLNDMIGQHLIVTDGTTLLGADDKAGVSEIVTAVEYLKEHPEISHRETVIAFTTDEEIGRGADHFDLNFGAKWAYTVDGGFLGEIEYENFNAAAAKITVHGINIHPGSAKNRMKNAVLMANDFINGLPGAETPAHTEGYEGFYHITDICGNESEVVINMIIRDHNADIFAKRKNFVSRLCEYLNSVYGKETFELDMRDSYRNMKQYITPRMHIIHRAEAAMTRCGVTPKIVPIRGGTDGARLSAEGLPCPNLSTGGENFHGINELVSIEAMETMVKVITELACQGDEF